MSALAVVVEEGRRELRRVVYHLLQRPDGLALCLRQRAEDGKRGLAFIEQGLDVGRARLDALCPLSPPPAFARHRAVVFLLHTPTALALIGPDGLTCYLAVADVTVLIWTALVHVSRLYYFLFPILFILWLLYPTYQDG